MVWMLLVLFYGLAKGGREICKKKALTQNSVTEVLFFYTLISFALVLPQAPRAGGVELKQYLLIALKSFMIFAAWLCSFNAIKKLPISLMGVLDLSRVLFATLMGVFFLGESMRLPQLWGLALVSLGLLLLPLREILLARRGAKSEAPPVNAARQCEPVRAVYVALALISCVLNAVSGTMDKYLMSESLTSGQLQFWYMLFLTAYYGIYILVKRIRLDWRKMLRNHWIWILAVLFVLADRALFIANGYADSRVTVMTLI
ncbi:MAG: EamA family transporter, partial [Butyrivibrio sp.]|nr:EamA family transporter [Butyrivibrio sp.]